MKLALSYVALAVAGCFSPVMAAQLQGQITDNNGTPIPNAHVSIDGGKKTTSDTQGHYQLSLADNSHVHLHVSNDNFKHADHDLHIATGTVTQNVSLEQAMMENIVVTASPFLRSAMESTTPISVMTEDQLKLNIEPTLGDTLEKLPGVQASHFGAGASRPIIRGMSGPRVMVLENGLSVGDASTVSADHAVTTEAGTAQQIEILRGPGSLLYGNAAIGGVVNVVNNRVHEQSVDELSGNFGTHYVTGNNGRTVNGELNGGDGKFNWHLDGTHRNTDDFNIAGNAIEGQAETHGSVTNSQLKLDDYAAGVGYTGDNSFVSLSGANTQSNYGIPGRGVQGDPDITIDLKKTAWQLHSGLFDPFAGVSKIRFDAGYTDYQHAEQENGDADTFFYNKQSEARLSVNNTPWGEWQGVMGLHAIHRDFSVQGEEALTPDSKTDTIAAFIVQERKFGDFRIELGSRIEHYRLNPDSMSIETLNGSQNYQPDGLSDNNITLSAGVVWDFATAYNLGLSIERAERSATAEELYSFGAHDATQSFEVGSQFKIENGNVIPDSGDSDKEIANNIDLTLRKLEGAWTGSFSVAYNKINDFYYEKDTGLVASDIGSEGDLPVYQFTQGDAELYSVEAQANIPFNDTWSLDLLSDYTRGKLVDGGNLPLISPMRFGSTLNFDQQDWHAEVGVMGYAKQTDTAENETDTAGYALVDTALTYHLPTENGDMMFYVKGNNLLDQDARPHTSLLKEYSPLMGRSFMLGMNYDF
ncbi:TonB-dependent receptor plug domain-containing protein [Shewanella sp. GutDb-MelDb]|uniref:TonB-dependent receptor n=1 Tax=Shewanella sp. GutDb-MelDb TaxID=2058316 RepID=UPI000C7E0755|nr:TonB-dependent receptor plug domain-containing protein [Shewanella sp. GutDb-MelDb]PKG57756.1 TonB-dependent receptor [Shewanella sp. GutDb-MelDb]